VTAVQDFYAELARVLRERAEPAHDALVAELKALRERSGRLFVLGVGGGAANAAHAVNDFRKLCEIEAYAPTDGIAELTARANDEGWETVFAAWLERSHLSRHDALLIFSVGGGTSETSACIRNAVLLAEQVGAPVLGVVGRPDGATASVGRAVVVTEARGRLLTPVTEAAQVAVLHALASDPRLQVVGTTW
jgi:D-sedoheptulose 7-phosphate isomerase